LDTSNTSKQTNLKLIAWLGLLFLAVVWGLSFILIKKIVHDFTAIELGAGRIFIAGLALSPWAIKNLKNYPKEKSGYLLLSGLLGYLIPAFIFGILGSKLNSSLSGTLNSTTPLFVLLVGAMFFGKKIQPNQISGILIGFVGSLILVLSSGKGDLNFDNPYALLAIIATIMYGFNANILGKYLMSVKPIMLSAYSLMFVGIIAFMVLLFTDFFQKIFLPQNHEFLIYFILLGALNSGLAAVIYNYVLQISSPVFASSVTYLIPVVAVIAGLIDHETVSVWHYLGMIIILAGVYLLNRKS
jgi:drug/metabolite transporter (DMT)-like permease